MDSSEPLCLIVYFKHKNTIVQGLVLKENLPKRLEKKENYSKYIVWKQVLCNFASQVN